VLAALPALLITGRGQYLGGTQFRRSLPDVHAEVTSCMAVRNRFVTAGL
jgi:hypothetical protein